MERRIEKRQLANIVALFLIVQFGGLLIAAFSFPPSQLVLLRSYQTLGSGGGAYVLYLVLFIIAAAAAMMVVFRLYKGMLLFRAFEAYAIGLPSLFLFLLLISDFFPELNQLSALAVSALLAAFLVIAKNRKPGLRNTATVISSIGIGVIIGLQGFYLAYLIMAVIALYDNIAVFVTKHMQVMAKAMAERNLAFLIGSSDTEMVPGSSLTAKERAAIAKNIKPAAVRNPEVRAMMKKGAYPTVSQVALGAGDLALPLMLVVGAYISFAGFFIPVMAAVGAAFGLLLTMRLLQRYMAPLPAIPPLFASMSLFIGAALILSGLVAAITGLEFAALFAFIMLALILTLKRNAVKARQAP